MSTARIDTPAEVFYPERDGAPLGETQAHIRAIFGLLAALDQLYRGREDVFIAGDGFLYYEEGNPRAVKAPDVMVVRGVAHEPLRRIFKTWVEGQVPFLIVEVTSPETRREDFGPKRDLYARLGVAEYILFDPLEEYLSPPLQGYRLDAGRYVPIVPEADGSLVSRELQARLIAEGAEVRLQGLDAEAPIPTLLELADGYREEKVRADEEARRADEEARRADALAAEVERLRALLGGGGG